MPEKEEQEKNTRKREGSRVFTIYRQSDQGQKASTKSIKQLAAGCWLLAAGCVFRGLGSRTCRQDRLFVPGPRP